MINRLFMRYAVRLSLKVFSFARHKRSHASDQPFVYEVCSKALTEDVKFYEAQEEPCK